jgi:hypothetical protein
MQAAYPLAAGGPNTLSCCQYCDYEGRLRLHRCSRRPITMHYASLQRILRGPAECRAGAFMDTSTCQEGGYRHRRAAHRF